MNPYIDPYVAEASRLLVPVLGPFVAELLQAQMARLALAIDNGSLDDELLRGAVEIVRSIGSAYPYASNEEKHRASAARIQHAAQQHGRRLPDALLNQIIELAVQRLKSL
jgi:hypothetical protein